MAENDSRYRILVGVDGSEDGLRAVRLAAGAAKLHDGVLELAHAYDDATMNAWGILWDPTLLEESGKEIIKAAIDVAVDHGLPRERIEPKLVRGDASGVLTRLSQDVDLIVVGRRARSGIERMFVGSTSAGLAATAKCPVITISQASTPQDTGANKRIGVTVDMANRSDVALKWAFQEAARRGCELHIIHVVPELPPGITARQPISEETTASLTSAAMAELDKLVDPVQAQFPQVKVAPDVAFGNPVDAIVEQSSNLDLVILGAHGVGFPGMQLSGVVRGVMTHAKCPVAVVRSWSNEKFGIQ